MFGARHDLVADPGSFAPYMYGHGFTVSDLSFRAIMAYSNECGSCPVKLFWSSPKNTFQNYVLGDYTYADNQRVLEENYNRMLYLGNNSQTLTVYNSDVSSSWAKTIYAGGDMVTSGNVIIQWGRNYLFRAENTIELLAGFEVEGGSTFEAIIRGCGEEDGSPTDYKKEVSITKNDMGKIQPISAFVYPTVTSGSFSIVFKEDYMGSFVGFVYSINGKLVDTFSGNVQSSSNSYDYSIQGRPSGTYIIKIETQAGHMISQKIIKY